MKFKLIMAWIRGILICIASLSFGYAILLVDRQPLGTVLYFCLAVVALVGYAAIVINQSK